VEELYKIGWQDSMHYNVKQVHRRVLHVVYNILDIDGHVRKELIGMYVSQSGVVNFCHSKN